MDDVFVAPLWRSLQQEDVHLKACAGVIPAAMAAGAMNNVGALATCSQQR
jgi:hypothetical protein